MKLICLICQKLISESEEEPELISHGMHFLCGLEYYRELDLLPLLTEI